MHAVYLLFRQSTVKDLKVLFHCQHSRRERSRVERRRSRYGRLSLPRIAAGVQRTHLVGWHVIYYPYLHKLLNIASTDFNLKYFLIKSTNSLNRCAFMAQCDSMPGTGITANCQQIRLPFPVKTAFARRPPPRRPSARTCLSARRPLQIRTPAFISTR